MSLALRTTSCASRDSSSDPRTETKSEAQQNPETIGHGHGHGHGHRAGCGKRSAFFRSLLVTWIRNFYQNFSRVRMHLEGPLTEVTDLSKDLVGGLGPHERLGLVVVDIDILENRTA
jgi:hypothetical protein